MKINQINPRMKIGDSGEEGGSPECKQSPKCEESPAMIYATPQAPSGGKPSKIDDVPPPKWPLKIVVPSALAAVFCITTFSLAIA